MYTKKFETYVKDELFKKLKFFNIELMLYNNNKNSVCQKVCDYMNLDVSGRTTFWNTYCKCVESAIRCARNDAVQAMKQSFLKGKLLIHNFTFEYLSLELTCSFRFS